MKTNEAVNKLYDLAKKCSKADPGASIFSDWDMLIQQSSVKDLVTLIGRLQTRDKSTSRELKALREQVISEIERKNAVSIVDTMKQLQISANRLTKSSVVITVVGIFVGIVGIAITVATVWP